MPNLVLTDVMMCFEKNTPVLDLATFTIPAGEHIAIMGPSGSGKTTLISILSGLERATHGSVCWDEVNLSQLSQSERDRWRAQHIGLVMQDFHLYSGLNVINNVLLPAQFRYWRIPEMLKQRATYLLDRMGISIRDRSIESLSRGEMQRVAVARALLLSPPILIADEPTASIDVHHGEVVINLMVELAKEANMTLIVVTHDLRFESVLPRHVFVENGNIIKDVDGGMSP